MAVWKKLTSLTATTTPALTDIIYVVKDPTGTPLSRKCTFQSFRDLITPDDRRSLYLSGDLTLVDTDVQEQFLNPNGADRYVDLPTVAGNNHTFNITNTGGNLLQRLIVRDASADIVGIVSRKQTKTFFSSSTAWYSEGAWKQIWLPAGALKPRVTSGCNDVATYESPTNYQNLDYLLFLDSGTTFAVGRFVLPGDYIPDREIYAELWYGFAATATGNDTFWTVKSFAYTNNNLIEQAYTAIEYQTLTASALTANKVYSGYTDSFVPDGTPEPGDLVNIQISRFPAMAQDTAACNVMLFGVTIYYPTTRG